ncbi:MAG: hypothetical protein IJZ65_07650 [Ruminiclostridium sp.]|nr:hypothetical protein [Ruminiclostridium sp.]
MRIDIRQLNNKNPEALKYRKPNHKAEIAVIIIGVLVMLFPIVVDMGHPAPVISTEIIGILCLLVGIVTLVDSEKRHKRITAVIATGKKYTALITRINHVTRRKRSGANRIIDFYCAECEFTDTETNNKYLYNSAYTVYNLRGTEGSTVTVFVNPDDRSDYYVDLTTILDGEQI